MARDPYRRAARRARRAIRKGEQPYPMMMFGPGEPLGAIAAEVIGRWLYRHRSAFVPFLVAGAAFITAALAHPRHSRYWLLVAMATVLGTVLLGISHQLWWSTPAGKHAAGFLARMWAACGIDRATERAYAACAVAVTGGWLSAAIAAGPTVKPLPQIAVTGTVALGIPWWIHRRRRARVRVNRTIEAWPDIARPIGLAGSHIASVVADAWGWTARVILRKGTSAEEAITKIPAIESALGVRRGSVRVFPDESRADTFILRVIETDPHANTIDWPGTGNTSVTQSVGLGLFEDGREVLVKILRRNILIGGTTGAGKSGIVNIILAVLIQCRDVEIWGVDMKGGMELAPWAACLTRIAFTPGQANQLFRDAVIRLNQRAERMAAEGKRVWEPTPDDPALIIVVDEYAEMPDEAHDCADSIARRGRAVAVNLIAATQRPTQSAMGKNTSVRSQMDVRICLRVRERRDVDLILGQGSFNAGWHAHALTKPGAFLISDPEHVQPERARGYLMDDARIERHAREHATTQPDTGTNAPDKVPAAQEWPQTPATPPARTDTGAGGTTSAKAALWTALRGAGPHGVSVADLVAATGKGRTWVYERLREHAAAGQAIQTARGHWRAAGPRDEQASE
jgi:S-DNA-T family DNA segregation ATPase FtsK/SpoIIIE